nr:MAG TPA: hypothetical protein [Caudoviricetes sp.]
MTFSQIYGVVFSRCLKTPLGGQRHPTVWPFLCPFFESQDSFWLSFGL